MKKIILLFQVALLALTSCKGQQNEAFKQVSSEEFSTQIEANASAPIIDVRTPEEFQEGHLQNAKNINFHSETFEKDILLLDKNQTVFIYCRSGGRSTSAANKMIELGFTDIVELDNGFLEWSSQNRPMTK